MFFVGWHRTRRARRSFESHWADFVCLSLLVQFVYSNRTLQLNESIVLVHSLARLLWKLFQLLGYISIIVYLFRSNENIIDINNVEMVFLCLCVCVCVFDFLSNNIDM